VERLLLNSDCYLLAIFVKPVNSRQRATNY
jgi:hypothetical protein